MRLQLALNVHDLDAAIEFYSKLFATPPTKIRPGYANFAIADPPLKLVLFEANGKHPEAANGPDFHLINHLGVETETSQEVVDAEARLRADGIDTTGVDDTECCYAEKTETWVTSPDGARWEWYVKTADTDTIQMASRTAGDEPERAEQSRAGTCCPM
jgi:catechol 2,3-dioxygenase-like lactoylglutathione lyase family enzyme